MSAPLNVTAQTLFVADEPSGVVAPTAPVHMEGIHKRALETGRNRLVVTGIFFAVAFSCIGARLIGLTLQGGTESDRLAVAAPEPASVLVPRAAGIGRADIVDRNGIVLATSLPTAELYADPHDIIDPQGAASELAKVLPDTNRDELLAKLSSPSRFVWLSRSLTPSQQYDVNKLGIPGIRFQRNERRIYPHGNVVSHVLGVTDIDGRGIAGVERQFESTLSQAGAPLQLSLDVRIQAILHQELTAAVAEFNALGGAGLVMDVATGEVIAMVSLPDFDPNVGMPTGPAGTVSEAGFNRATKGVYEMGSTFKLFNTAMVLDSGSATVNDRFDARFPIHISRFTITDYHGKNSWLSIPEILIYSSNIGSAKMALGAGIANQQAYLGAFGMLKAPTLELPEIGRPLVPAHWREINSMTIAYGHGMAVSPLQMVTGVSAVVNGGILHPATLLKRDADVPVSGKRVITERTSTLMRAMMRMVVREGTGTKGDVPGYLVGGKTGTAEKQFSGVYKHNALVSSFIAAFPLNRPRYVVMSLIDEPHGNKKSFGFATAGWTATPVVGHLIARMAPLVGLAPVNGEEPTLDDARQMVSVDAEARASRVNSLAAN
jgi:cell division protein FtsI (penicillin-binding protein 3)